MDSFQLSVAFALGNLCTSHEHQEGRVRTAPHRLFGDLLPQGEGSHDSVPLPVVIRTNLRVQRSTAVSCRGSGSRRLAGGHALAGRTCSQIRPPEGNVTNIVPRQPARGNAERPPLSALARACPAAAASTPILPFAPPCARLAARHLVRCVPVVR